MSILLEPMGEKAKDGKQNDAFRLLVCLPFILFCHQHRLCHTPVKLPDAARQIHEECP